MTDAGYRAHVDGLRAVAVLAVVAYHAGAPGFVGGYVGVDVFFVISGFLITGMLFREFEEHGNISLAGFYERRIRRLAPALLLVLLVTLALGAVFLTPIGGEQQGLAKSAIATVALVSNLYFARTTGDYFDGPAEAQPLLHTWSLSVEEQFYLVWPLALWLVSRWAKRRGFHPDRAVVAMLLLTVGVSLPLSIATTSTNVEFAFFGSPTRAWEFAIGGLSFFFSRQCQSAVPYSQSLAFVGLVAIVWAIFTFAADQTPFPGYLAAVPVLGTAAVILGCEHTPRGWCRRLLSTGPLVFVGLISYSLYLWHWPLLVVARLRTLGEIGPADIAVVCAVALLLAWLTYQFVENPIRRKQLPIMATRRSALLRGAMASLLVALCAGALGVWAKFVWPQFGENAELRRAFSGLDTPKLPDCVQPRPYSGQLVPAANCALPKQSIHPEILVWGDSHAFHLSSVVSAYVSKNGSRARVRFMAGCPPLLSYDPNILISNGAQGCSEFNEDVLREIANLRNHGLRGVVLSARWPVYLSPPNAQGVGRKTFKQTIVRLQELGIRVTVMAPLPLFPHRVPPCLLRRELSECSVSRVSAEDYRRVSYETIRMATSASPAVQILDPMSVLCAGNVCPPTLRGEVLYYDDNHLSNGGSLSLMPLLSPALDWMRERKNPLDGSDDGILSESRLNGQSTLLTRHEYT